MSNENNTLDTIHTLEERLNYLESVNQQYRFGVDVLRVMNESMLFTQAVGDKNKVFNDAAGFLRQICHWSDIIFLEIDLASSELVPSFIDSEDKDQSKRHVNTLIENGDIAWTMNQTKPNVNANAISGAFTVLQAMSTPAGITGMFIGVIKKQSQEPPSSIIADIVGIMVNTVSSTIKNLEHIQTTRKRGDDLEKQLSKSELEREYELTHDSETGLINRDTLLNVISEHVNVDPSGMMLVVGIDRYTVLRDSLSHEQLSNLMIKIAQRLSNMIEQVSENSVSQCALAKLDTNEFAIYVSGENRVADGISWVERVRSCFQDAITIDDEHIAISTCEGVALYPQDATAAQTLIDNANLALTEANQRGSNTYRFYSDKLNSRAEKRLKLLNSLHMALENNEFRLHFQPIHHLVNRRCIGYESFIRWQRSEDQLLPPAQFLSFLEQNDALMYDVGLWVLRESISAVKLMERNNIQMNKISVNLSARQLHHRSLVTDLSALLTELNVSPEWLELEVTETALMQNISKSLTSLNELHELGVGISIDDFGTGYSSLNYLKRMPIKIIKIDRSFVKGLPFDTDDTAIVKTIIQLAHNLNIKTVAEGIEFNKQATLLRELGCDFGQGFLFCKPHPIEFYLKSKK